jgi:hypothetical protein
MPFQLPVISRRYHNAVVGAKDLALQRLRQHYARMAFQIHEVDQVFSRYGIPLVEGERVLSLKERLLRLIERLHSK